MRSDPTLKSLAELQFLPIEARNLEEPLDVLSPQVFSKGIIPLIDPYTWRREEVFVSRYISNPDYIPYFGEEERRLRIEALGKIKEVSKLRLCYGEASNATISYSYKNSLGKDLTCEGDEWNPLYKEAWLGHRRNYGKLIMGRKKKAQAQGKKFVEVPYIVVGSRAPVSYLGLKPRVLKAFESGEAKLVPGAHMVIKEGKGPSKRWGEEVVVLGMGSSSLYRMSFKIKVLGSGEELQVPQSWLDFKKEDILRL